MTWSRDPTFFPDWRIESTGSTQRITEDGRLRVTEQGNIRIIERFEIKWNLSPPGFSPWTSSV